MLDFSLGPRDRILGSPSPRPETNKEQLLRSTSGDKKHIEIFCGALKSTQQE